MKVFDSLKKKRTLKLWDEAQVLLGEGAYEEVLRIAERLERERYTGAFDLAARAYASMGKRREAIAALERGVAVAPQAWPNWELLGSYRSDEGEFDAAASAYRSALECEAVWVDSVRLNQAILADRRGSFAEALATVELVQDPDLALRKAELKAHLLLATQDSESPFATSSIRRPVWNPARLASFDRGKSSPTRRRKP